jgi:hypothetical protein
LNPEIFQPAVDPIFQTASPPMPYALPSDHDRRALFHWLKQASSLTAWRRLYAHHQAFVDAVTKAYEDEQKAPDRPTHIETSLFAAVLRAADAFSAGLEHLAQGDRRCFTFLGARGHFSEGLLQVEWWQDMYMGRFMGRNGWSAAESPSWPLIEKAMHRCLAARNDIGVVLQRRMIDEPAWIEDIRDYLVSPHSSLIKLIHSQSMLPVVPPAMGEPLVPTGQIIPVYGVWEPIRRDDVSRAGRTPKGVPYQLGPTRKLDGYFLDGCMNYLHGGFAAPTLGFEEDVARDDGRPTIWRLVWRDDRYGEKPIPEEEASYTFVQPVTGEILFEYDDVPRPL